MGLKLNVEEFITDYCDGVNDRDLLAKFKITAKEMVGLVRKLINEGRITKEQYFSRSQRIEERESRQEKAFLQSLSHCPICGHIQPIAFTICPACGTDVSEVTAPGGYASGHPGITLKDRAVERHLSEHETDSVVEPSAAETSAEVTTPVSLAEATAAAEAEPASQWHVEVPEAVRLVLGMALEDLVLLPKVPESFFAEDYIVTELVSYGMQSALFKADSASGSRKPVSVKILHREAAPEDILDQLIQRIIYYQSEMLDPNIVRILGSGRLGGVPALVYEYLPLDLERLIQGEPEGLPLDLALNLLPQILNGLGYSHMHRGSDGTVRRVPHINLRLSKFLVDEDKQVVKLEGCGVWRALVDVRGFKRHLWEEPGADIAALPPESFIQENRLINSFLVDTYQLGVALYRMVTGTVPFVGTNLEEYSFMHLRKYPIPPRVHRYTIPAWLDAMILRCLEKEPSKRWRSATQMELAIGKGVAD